MKRDPLLWAALAAALVVTASAEYELARAVGFGQVVAGGVPAALDVYVLRALRARRDVAAVVIAMVLVNAASHLVAAGLLPITVPLVVAVSAIAPLVLWRVHRLAEHIASTPDAPADEASTPPEVYAEQVFQRPAVEAAPKAEPLVICGAHQVYDLDVPPGFEVDTGQAPRLTADQATNVLRAAWVNGTGVREAARLSTRSVSYAAKVYTRLEGERGPQPGLGPVTQGVSA